MDADDKLMWQSYSFNADYVGGAGEAVTFSTLSDLMLCVRNIYLPNNRGYFTEIDIIGISKFGLIVVENKNYHCTISGNCRDDYWYCNYGNKKESLYSPIKQNREHVLVLRNCFDFIRGIPIYNTVIFNDFARLKLDCINDFNVYKLSDFVTMYKRLALESVLSIDDISRIANIFRKYSDISNEMKVVHKALMRNE